MAPNLETGEKQLAAIKNPLYGFPTRNLNSWVIQFIFSSVARIRKRTARNYLTEHMRTLFPGETAVVSV